MIPKEPRELVQLVFTSIYIQQEPLVKPTDLAISNVDSSVPEVATFGRLQGRDAVEFEPHANVDLLSMQKTALLARFVRFAFIFTHTCLFRPTKTLGLVNDSSDRGRLHGIVEIDVFIRVGSLQSVEGQDIVLRREINKHIAKLASAYLVDVGIEEHYLVLGAQRQEYLQSHAGYSCVTRERIAPFKVLVVEDDWVV